jgi:hypothetical protein
MSDTAFFRLENTIKDTLQIEHVIHIPIRNECKILVSRQTFHIKNELKVNLAKWNQHLNSEDVRECGSLPEVAAYIRKDNYSDDESSFFATVSGQSCTSNMMKRQNRMISPYINPSLLLQIYLQVSQYPLTYPTLRMKVKL